MPTLHLPSEASGSEQLLEVVTTSGSEPNHDDHQQQARKAGRLGCIWSLCGCASAIPTWSSTTSFKLDFDNFFSTTFHSQSSCMYIVHFGESSSPSLVIMLFLVNHKKKALSLLKIQYDLYTRYSLN